VTEPRSAVPDDVHEWVSFDDPDEDRTWVLDITFLTSNWACIFGAGCQGVLTGPAPELEQGCCSYGAHFTGPDDIAATTAYAERLTDTQWQFAETSRRKGGPLRKNKEGETVTRLVDGACIFLNRPEFAGGAGCALHRAALEVGERPLDWKPDVCWQLPLRLTEEADAHGHLTSTLREWKRRDWGAGGAEFHWWCTAEADAFVGAEPVYAYLRDEVVELIGEAAYRLLVDHLEERAARAGGQEVFLPHPALRVRR
jgi:hypothetical protein